jgi:hypothetical protein
MYMTRLFRGTGALCGVLYTMGLLLVALPSARCVAAENAPAAALDEAAVLKALKPGHPRLILTEADVERIRRDVAADPVARRYAEQLKARGEGILKEAPIERVLIGPRLLDKSRRLVDRIYTLGLLYRLDGNKVWKERVIRELEAAAAFQDWNPSHFLDVAEMTHGFAVGYDWLYNDLTPDQRRLIRTAMVEKGLKPAQEVHEKKGWWTTSEFNWNNVCNGGILSGALAVADEEPALAGQLIVESIQKLPRAIATFGPDGAWSEGPGYWGYAMRYTVVALASLQTALGQDYGLGDIAGMDQAGFFRVHAVGPTGLFFNFADAGDKTGDEPSLFWLARRYHQPALAVAAREASQRRSSAQDLLFYEAQGSDTDLKVLPLDRFFKGADVVFYRSAWNDPNALYVGWKGGDNKANHSNLDLGTFVLDAQGQRWAIELGGDEYNLPGYFGNKRWTYYRLRTEGQNTLTIDDQNQDPKAAAPITAFSTAAGSGYAIADLKAGYAGVGATRALRGMAIVDRRRRVLMQDEVETRASAKIVWAMHTRANIALEGSTALLTQDGQTLEARILSPSGARFESQEVNLPPPQYSTKGIRKLLVVLPGTTHTQLTILFSPGDVREQPFASDVPLDKWGTVYGK